ncbi:MAG: hypothetical protein ACHQIK_06540 [Candidatus Acidiferrales bacterium]
MKLRSKLLLLSLIVICGFCVLSVVAGAQEAPAPPTPPVAPPFVPPVPPLSPADSFYVAAPASPAAPPIPAVPAVPASPASPAEPPSPFGLDDDHSTRISDGHHHPINDCSDLDIRFDDRNALMKSEERTVTKAEAPTLRVHPHKNGGVQVQGWDKDVYSITACKAAADYHGSAERILSQIKLAIQGGKVSTTGPDNEPDWTVYLLIRAPKAAVIDLETANGPLSLYSVDGKLTAHATNGPISLRDFSGDADVEASNGPITITGGSGNLRIHTQNGPISINLEGKNWSGTGLTADAQNGPLTLSVPADYQSSFVVESRNYSPMSCRARICDNARKTWDDNNRRIEFGSSPALIRLSTVNGPVSVQSAREER